MILTFRRLLAISTLAVVAGAIFADELTIDLAIQRAVDGDQQVRLLERQLREQLEELGLKGYLDKISLTLSGSVTGDDDEETDSVRSGSAILAASLEIIPQITIDGSISATDSSLEVPGADEDVVTGSVGVTVLPLAVASRRPRERLAARSTAVEVERARNAAVIAATTALFDLVEASETAGISDQEVDVAERVLEATLTRHERGLATDSELTNARQAARRALQARVRNALAVERGVATNQLRLGLEDALTSVPDIATIGIDEWESRALRFLSTVSAAELATRDFAVAEARLALEVDELDRRDARLFDPSFTLTASTDLPDREYEIAAEITLSPSQWDATEVADARADLAHSQSELAIAIRLAEFDAISAINELRFAVEDLGAAERAVSDATVAVEEAQFRLERGGITQLESDQARLQLDRANVDLVIARIAVVRRYMAIEFGYRPESTLE